MDVDFGENAFPFSSLHPNVGAQLRSEILLLPNDVLHEHGNASTNDQMPNVLYIPMYNHAPQLLLFIL
jgi:hypothetical protein